MKRIAALLSAVFLSLPVFADSNSRNLRAELRGIEESPTVSTVASGDFRARINSIETEISFELNYSDLEGSVTQAHIHLGQRHVSAGISVWLCSNLASPPTPVGTPACPAPPGEVSGTFSADDVVGPAGQGIAPMEFAELIRAIRSGVTYVNVHSTKFPGGEIRGQIRPGGRGDGNEDDD